MSQEVRGSYFMPCTEDKDLVRKQKEVKDKISAKKCIDKRLDTRDRVR